MAKLVPNFKTNWISSSWKVYNDLWADFQLSHWSAKEMQLLSISDDVKTFQLSATATQSTPFFVIVAVWFLELQIHDRTTHWLEPTALKKTKIIVKAFFIETEAVLILQQINKGRGGGKKRGKTTEREQCIPGRTVNHAVWKDIPIELPAKHVYSPASSKVTFRI